MRPIPGTITDPASDVRLGLADERVQREKLERALEEADLVPEAPLDFDSYSEATDDLAMYPRAYSEDQVRTIVHDVLQQYVLYGEDEANERITLALNFYETDFNRLVYPILGLVGEAGETANKLKKILRGDTAMDMNARMSLVDEVGDVLWYVSQTATELGQPLERVAYANIRKLRDRKRRGTFLGNGDNR